MPDDWIDGDGEPTSMATTPHRRDRSLVDKRDSNANNILMSPNLMRPAPANPNNRFMNSVKAVYKSLSSCKVLIESLADRQAAAAAGAAETTVSRSQSAAALTAVHSDSEDGLGDDSDGGELFEFEEAEAPHVPLYTLRDEGAVKWAMLTDLCGILKVKSKETLMKQVGPGGQMDALSVN